MSINPFDAKYQELRSPTGQVEYGLTKNMAELLLLQNPDAFRKNIIEIAQNNDIQSLTVAMQLVEGLRAAAQASSTNSTGEVAIPPEFVYCVTHMLVDGAGNDEFARTWLETFEHTPFKAGEMYRRNPNREEMSVVDMQRRVGLASIGDVFSSYGFNPTKAASFITVMQEAANLTSNALPNLRTEVAAVLRMLSPDRLPVLEMQWGVPTPAADVMWANKFMAPVMTAIGDAYQPNGVPNLEVQAQMREALGRALQMDDTVRLNPGSRNTFHWETIAQWADEGTPDQLWAGKFGIPYWTKDQNGSTRQVFRTGGFPEAIEQGLRGMNVEIIEKLANLGLDLNRESRETRKNGEIFGRRLIDIAGDTLNPDLLGSLIAMGVEPDVPNYEAPGNMTQPKTAIERFEAHRNVTAPMELARFEKADSILRSWGAKREALQALREMMDSQETARPIL